MFRSITPILLVICALAGIAASGPAMACGTVSADCDVFSGDYRIYLPANSARPSPEGAVLFFHGWKGSSNGVMRNQSLRALSDRLNIAIVAANGLEGTWSYPGSPAQERDEFTYVTEILEDIETRFDIPRERVMAAGFSMGASMVWNLSCQMGSSFAGFAPMAGTFWDPLPQTCPSETPNLMHYHGRKDGTFPLAGRSLGSGRYKQGDTYKGFEVWRSQGACQAEEPAIVRTGLFQCERHSGCGSEILELCLHEGGHIYRAAWIERSWGILSDLKGW